MQLSIAIIYKIVYNVITERKWLHGKHCYIKKY